MKLKIRREWILFIIINSGFLAGALLLMPYRAIAGGALKNFIFCPIHELFQIYCPTCGVTRALDSILHLKFGQAWIQNPCIVLLVLLIAYYDIRAFISLIRGEERVCHIKRWQAFCYIGILIIHGVVRDIMLVNYGIDPLGDFPQYTGALILLLT